MQLQRQVRPPRAREPEPYEVCLHKDTSNGVIAGLMILAFVGGAFIFGALGLSWGYSKAYDQGYAGESRIQRAYDKGKEAKCDL